MGNLVKNFDLVAVYPPSVSLLHDYQEHLIAPDRYDGEWLPLVSASGAPRESRRARAEALRARGLSIAEIEARLLEEEQREHATYYRIRSQDDVLGPGDLLTLSLETGTADGALVPHQVRSARVYRAASTTLVGEATLVPEREGKTWIGWSAQTAQPEQGDLRVEVELALGERMLTVQHFFQAAQRKVGDFDGTVHERLLAGSLEVEFELDLTERLQCTFSGLLYDDTHGLPIARATRHDVLEPGHRKVPLLFYGKVFHDAEFKQGKLSVRELRGTCTSPKVQSARALAQAQAGQASFDEPDPSQPDGTYLFPTRAVAYRSMRAYRVGEFTDQPWNSLQKRRYRRALDELQQSRDAHRKARAALQAGVKG